MVYKDSSEMVMMLMGAGSVFAALAIIFAAAALICRRRRRAAGSKGCAVQMLLFIAAGLPFLFLPLAVYASGSTASGAWRTAETGNAQAPSSESEAGNAKAPSSKSETGGSEAEGSKTGESETEESEIEGSESEGSEAEGSETDESETEESENGTEESETGASETDEPETESSETDEPDWNEKELAKLLKKARFSFTDASGEPLARKDLFLQTGGKAQRPGQVKMQIRIMDFEPADWLGEGTPFALRIDGGQDAWQKKAQSLFLEEKGWEREKEECVWEMPFAQDGRYRLQVGVRSKEKETLTVYMETELILDTKAPLVRLDPEQEGQLYRKEDCRIRFYVEDTNPDPGCTPQTRTEGVSAGFSGWEQTGGGLKGELILRGEGTAMISFTARDQAGNLSASRSLGPVVIDKEPPVLQILPAEGIHLEERLYASSPQTVLLTAKDPYFDPSSGSLHIEGTGGSWRTQDWQQEDGVWHRLLYLEGDGSYKIHLESRDLAGNTAQRSLPETIVVDTISPTVRIAGAEDSVSYQKGIKLSVTGKDDNLYFGSMRIILLNQLNGKQIEREGRGGEDTVSCELETKEDGIYLLQVLARDAAGNEKREQIRFRVNRSGSRIEPDEDTGALLLSGFMREASPLVFTEYNIDTLTDRRLVLVGTGRARALQEGTDYLVEENMESDGTHSFRYRVAAACFSEEGEYTLHIYTKDAAGNAYAGGRQEALFRFTADYKVPVITIAGLEDGKLYRTEEHVFTVQVSDTVSVSDLRVFVNGSLLTEQNRDRIWEAGGLFSLRLTPSDQIQEVRVEAEDTAGRRAVSRIIRVLVQAPDQPLPEEAKRLPGAIVSSPNTETEEETNLYRIPELVQDAAGGFRDSTDDHVKEIMLKAAAACAAVAVLLPLVLLLLRKKRARKGNP